MLMCVCLYSCLCVAWCRNHVLLEDVEYFLEKSKAKECFDMLDLDKDGKVSLQVPTISLRHLSSPPHALWLTHTYTLTLTHTFSHSLTHSITHSLTHSLNFKSLVCNQTVNPDADETGKVSLQMWHSLYIDMSAASCLSSASSPRLSFRFLDHVTDSPFAFLLVPAHHLLH